ncbi:MAG: ornithine aminomutase subunit alpha [Clostridiales bacterium]|nr:ornithine aminomutase subunit alpha [Clostridiales bacterium]
MKRADDFETRREHLKGMSAGELRDHFWSLAEKIVDPLLTLGYENTSPSVERSILLRMGFSSLEAKPIVEEAVSRNLLGHGAGNIVYRLAKSRNLSIKDAGISLAEGRLWDEAAALFGGGTR